MRSLGIEFVQSSLNGSPGEIQAQSPTMRVSFSSSPRLTDKLNMSTSDLPIMTFLAVGVGAMIFTFLPFFAIYHFANRPPGRKPNGLWMIALLLGWGIPAVFYAIKHMKSSKVAQAAGWVGLVTMVVGGIGMFKFVGALSNSMTPLLAEESARIKDLLYKAQNPDKIAGQDYLNAYSQIDQLQERVSSLEEMQKSLLLLDLMDHNVSDNIITRQEMKDWNSIFNAMPLIDGTKLSTYVQETKGGRQPASLPY